MTLDTLIMLAGLFVALLPFLGLPNSWDAVLLILAGIAIIGLGILARQRLGSAGDRNVSTPSVENASRESA